MTVPVLTPVGVLRVHVGDPVDLGPSPAGRRRMVAILGGTLEGDLGAGEVLAGGADWQTLHDDGSISVDAQYVIRLRDSDEAVTIRSTGVRVDTSDGVYFRTGIVFTGAPSTSDLARHLFVSSGSRTGSVVHLDLFRVG